MHRGKSLPSMHTACLGLRLCAHGRQADCDSAILGRLFTRCALQVPVQPRAQEVRVVALQSAACREWLNH
eukprot:1084137-Lingulodinium_polyedra.AAC.1